MLININIVKCIRTFGFGAPLNDNDDDDDDDDDGVLTFLA